MCERRSVRICCHESPHGEAIGSLMRLFRTVSVETVWKMARGSPWCVFGGATGQRLSFFTLFYRLVGLQFVAYPDFPNSFSRNCPKSDFSNAPTMDLAGIQRPNGPKSTFSVAYNVTLRPPPRLFG